MKAVETGTDGGSNLLPEGESGPSSQGIGAGAIMCLLSMSSVQFGSALSVPMIALYGVPGATWLRLGFAALILLIVVRPPVLRYTGRQLLNALILGAASAIMTLCFFSAMQRIPLGLTVAIDFLGPLAVATLGYGLNWRILFPVIAACGVLLLAYNGESWVGNVPGVLFACGAGTGWAIYIILTKKVGASFKGFEGLAMSLLAAAIVATPFGLPDAAPKLDGAGLLHMLGLALLVPLVPYALEMMALRRMPTSSFGILMSLEPAIGALAGFIVLAQPMTLSQICGTLLVVAASLGATFAAKS